MSPRGRLIAAQAAIVVIAAGVVYLTLLNPNGGGPLTGIEAPVGRDGGNGARHEADRRAQRQRPAGGPALAAVSPAGLAPAPVTNAPQPPAGERRPGHVSVDLTPTDVQYDDTVAQLDALLRMSGP